MKVKINDNYYILKNDLNCTFFKSLIEEKMNEIELTLFTDVFLQIYKDKEIEYHRFEIKDFEYYYKAFTYFGSDKELVLLNYFFLYLFYIENKEIALERVEWLENALHHNHNIKEYLQFDSRILGILLNKELSNFRQLDSAVKNYIRTNKKVILEGVRSPAITKHGKEYWWN